jgi:hypothetical protein
LSTRKLSMIFLPGIMLIALITACQKSPATVTPTRTATPLAMKGTATITTTVNAAMSPTPTLSQINAGGMLDSTPVPVWKGIPLLPGASAGTENSSGYLYSTTEIPSEIITFYAREMPKLGWEPKPKNGTPEPSGQIKLVFTKGNDMLLVAVFPRSDGALVMLGIQSK